MGKKKVTKKDIVETLHAHFHDAKIVIKRNEESGRFNGRILWEGFADKTLLDRQREVFEVLRGAFGPETRSISMLFAYTPHEYEQLKAVA